MKQGGSPVERIQFSPATRVALVGVLTLLAAGAGAAAGQFEKTPSYDPTAVLGVASAGSNYVVMSPVSSDGMLRHYTLHTRWGDFDAVGDQLMAARVKELQALHALDETNTTKSFGQAVLKAGMAPVVFAGHMIVNPVDTTQNTVAGVGQFVGDIRSGFNNMGKSRDDTVASLTGEAKEERLIATGLGVDPYTDFQPLAYRLNELAGAATAGHLAVSGAMSAVPGVAGLVVSNTSTVGEFGENIDDYDDAQLMDMNRDKLARLGVDGATADSLFANRNYTPVDITAMVAALGSIGAAKDLDAMVRGAAAADSRATAFFVRRRVELTAAWQKSHRSIVAFVRDDSVRFPLCQTADGAIVGVYPIDILSWTPETARSIEAMTAEARRNGATAKTLVISGTATPLARTKLAAQGWALQDRAKF
jgi:hypothetical protein